MSIEIKQLLIKSNIVQRAATATTDSIIASESETSEEQEAVKEQLLVECRRMILDIMREKEER